MFGNRAKISAEELAYMKEQLDNDRGFFENVNAKSKLMEADFDELEKSRQLQESSLKQLKIMQIMWWNFQRTAWMPYQP